MLHISYWIFSILNLAFISKLSLNVSLIFHSFILPLFYLNYFIFIPYFFRKKKKYFYALWVSTYFSTFCLSYAPFRLFLWGNPEETFIEQMPFSLWMAFTIAIYYGAICLFSRLAYDFYQNTKKTEHLEREKQKQQIESLRSYINIPFMLSSLSLAEKQTHESFEKTQTTILQLSNILKHNLYYNNFKNTNENIEFIKDLLCLIANLNTLKFDLTISNTGLSMLFLSESDTHNFLHSLKENFNNTLKCSIDESGCKVNINISTFNHHD